MLNLGIRLFCVGMVPVVSLKKYKFWKNIDFAHTVFNSLATLSLNLHKKKISVIFFTLYPLCIIVVLFQ